MDTDTNDARLYEILTAYFQQPILLQRWQGFWWVRLRVQSHEPLLWLPTSAALKYGKVVHVNGQAVFSIEDVHLYRYNRIVLHHHDARHEQRVVYQMPKLDGPTLP